MSMSASVKKRETIRDIDKRMNDPKLPGAIQEAFEETGCKDIFSGDPVMYVQVIGQQLRKQNEKIHEMEKAVHETDKLVSQMTRILKNK